MQAIAKQVFTAEVRAEAVKLVIDQGLTQSEVAPRLKISNKTLGRWVGYRKAAAHGFVDIDQAFFLPRSRAWILRSSPTTPPGMANMKAISTTP